MKSHRLVALLILSLPHRAISQQNTGTIIIVSVAPDKAIVATDSVTTAQVGREKVVLANDVCKIMVFDNKYIFAAAGYVERPGSWNIRDITKALYQSGNISSVFDFAKKWDDKMQTVLAQDYQISPPPTHNGKVVLAAIFIGIEGRRVDARYRVWSAPAFGAPILGESKSITPNRDEQALGEDDVFLEFKADQTARAKQWHQRIDQLSPEKRVTALAELVRDFTPGNGVGGEIDSVRITPSAGVEWLAVKPGCSQSYQQH